MASFAAIGISFDGRSLLPSKGKANVLTSGLQWFSVALKIMDALWNVCFTGASHGNETRLLSLVGLLDKDLQLIVGQLRNY